MSPAFGFLNGNSAASAPNGDVSGGWLKDGA